jgi:hypothetical protein
MLKPFFFLSFFSSHKKKKKIENFDGVNKHLNIKIPPIGSTPMNYRLNCNHPIDFSFENSLANAIGFQKIKYQYFQGDHSYHKSDKIIYKAKNVNSIKVMCNIIKDLFDNG